MAEEQSRRTPGADERLFELARRNPSPAGRELLREIIERGTATEKTERPPVRDIRAALRVPALDDPDYRSLPEQADWLGRESQTLRDLFERGAEVRGETLIIPAEEHELSVDRETPFITTVSYAREKIGQVAQADEFHLLARKIAGETADARTQVVTFKTYYDRISRDERGNYFGQGRAAERAEALTRALAEMRLLAREMGRLETRESLEAAAQPASLDGAHAAERLAGGGDREEPDRTEFDETARETVELDEDARDEVTDGAHGVESPSPAEGRDVGGAAGGLNVAARKVRLRDESLRLPVGLSDEVKERLIGRTLPEVDRRLEGGVSREALFRALDEKLSRRGEYSAREQAERARVVGFVKSYVDERLKDPETKALNSSPAFRQAHATLTRAADAEELGRAAAEILRSNDRRSQQLRLHRAEPEKYPQPEVMPLGARERSLLFNGRAPEHHLPEMRELRINYGLSREERAERAAGLREGRLPPSATLRTMLAELQTRRTERAVSHFQAGLINERMQSVGRLDLYRLNSRLAPHERTYLIEETEERKRALGTQPRSESHAVKDTAGGPTLQPAGRAFGTMPKESESFRDYMAGMGRIERVLLNEEISKRRTSAARANPDGGRGNLTITEARALLPESTRREVRVRASRLAWEVVAPPEVFERNPRPESLRISDTIAYLQEHLQEKARAAQSARNGFVAEKVRLAEGRLREEGREVYLGSTGRQAREVRRGEQASRATPLRTAAQERGEFVLSVLDKLSPADARRLAELDHYAAKAREDVYRGFEAIDAQRHDLEQAQARPEAAHSSPEFAAAQFGELSSAEQSGSPAARLTDRASAVTGREGQWPRVEGRHTPRPAGGPSGDRGGQEWRIDSLGEFLAERFEEETPAPGGRLGQDSEIERGLSLER
jgi:hypothetical protein